MDYPNGVYPPSNQQQYPPPPAYAQYYPPPRDPWLKPIRRNANIASLCLIFVVLLGVFVSPVLTGLSDLLIINLNILSPSVLSMMEITTELLVYVIMFVIPIAVMKLWIGIPSRVAFPMRRPRASVALPAIFVCLGTSVIGMFLYGIISTIIKMLFGVEPYMPQSPLPIGIPAAIAYFIRLAVAPAIIEELMFRGVIMQSLRRFGDMFALVCSSILFSLAHHNLVQGPNALLLGLVIGFFVLRTGSLRTGMLIHFVNNFLAVCTDYLSRTLPESGVQALSTFVLCFYIASGVICLLFLLISQSEFFHLAPASYPLPEKRKYSAFFLTATPVIYIIAVIIMTCLLFR